MRDRWAGAGFLPARTGQQMAVAMAVQENIRRFDTQGVPGHEIARRLGISRDSEAATLPGLNGVLLGRIRPVRYESRKADKIGNLLIGGNTYTARPKFRGRNLTEGLRHDVAQPLDQHAKPARHFPRTVWLRNWHPCYRAPENSGAAARAPVRAGAGISSGPSGDFSVTAGLAWRALRWARTEVRPQCGHVVSPRPVGSEQSSPPRKK
ncbi:hypothetical protein D7003_07670 [Arthrobacter oryzae]|uniref:Uncharacterized protein n=1 Tax=Arthrobacter oryzae TaxID=409290 RepID=A0A3N0C3F7_9MICC|nr:hypothetical protein D7003_07670 [Arthrobacter oryzae]